MTAAAALDGTAGAWGDGDMLCVALDASGQLIAATNNDVIGVIWTPEGRKSSVAGYKNVIGGQGTSPALTTGDLIYATAAGDVLDTGMTTGDVFVGFVAADVNDNGLRLVVDIGLLPAAT